MPDMSELSEARRILLERYLRGEPPRAAKSTNAAAQRPQERTELGTTENTRSPIVPIIPLQISGSRQPFFYLHPHVEGGAFYCFTLAHHLGPAQPFYILDPCRVDALPIPPTLEAIAAVYLEAMRSVQPEGPYLLGGFCGGGLIAFEVAQQLQAAGQEVALLLLIEAKDGPAPHRMHFRKSLGNFVRYSGNLLRLSQERQCDVYIYLEKEYIYLLHVYDYFRVIFRRLQNTLGLGTDEHASHGCIGDKARITFPRPREFGIANQYIGEPSEAWIGKFVWAISHYNTQQYPGKVTYFWASHTLEQEQLRMGRVEESKGVEAEELEMYVIPSNHSTIINEHIHDLAECLHACLSKVQVTALK